MLEQHYTRRGQRRSIDATCQIISRLIDEPIHQPIRDVSPFGAWVKTSLPLPIGERVVMTFAPATGDAMTVLADVTRIKEERGKAGMGLEFVDISHRERIALHRCLRGLPSGDCSTLSLRVVGRLMQ